MAREETIKVKVDKTEAQQSLQDLKKTADSIKKELGSIKIGDTAKAAKENARAAVEEAKAVKEQANAKKALAQAEKELENATAAKLRAQKQAQDVVTAQVRTEKEAVNLQKAQSQALKEAANAETARSRAQKAAIQTQNAINKSIASGSTYVSHYASALKSFAMQLVGFYGITTTLRKAFTEMKAMNDELVTYRKVTGATAADMQKMQSAAYSAAKQYGQSPSDFLASAATMARAGYKENSAAMAELATKTQLVGDMTAEQASKFLIAVDAAYKYQGNIKKLSSVLDSANEIDNRYATTIEKISEGMTLVASVAATAQVPIEQLMAALGTMTATTQREGSEAARGLRYILLHAMGDTTTEIEEGVTATEEGIQTLNEAVMKYGDEAAKAALKAGKMINPMEKIVALQKAWQKGTLTQEALYNIGTKVAGIRQYNMFAALVTNPDMYNSMMNNIANSAGSADKEWQAMMDSWSKKLEKLKATFTELVNNTISTDFIKSLIDAGTGALEFAGNLENLATMATGAYVAIKSLSSGLGNLAKGGKFGGFNAVTTGIGLIVSAVGAYKSYIEYQKKAATESAQAAAQATEDILNNTTNITKAIGEYKEITKDGIIDTSELSEAQRIQEQIKTIIGEQADAYDILNGKVEDNIALITSASIAYLQSKLTETKVKVADAASGLKTMVGAGNLLSPATGTTFRIDNDPRWTEIQKYSKANFDALHYNRTAPIDREGNILWEGLSYSLTSKTSLNGIVQFYESLVGLQDLFAELFTTEELSVNDGYKGILDVVSKLSPAVNAYTEALQNQYNVEANLLLLQDGFFDKKFDSKESLDSYIQELALENNLTEDQANALANMAQVLGNIKNSAEDGGKGMATAADGAITLANAINAATAAKNRFDEAMKTSKADALNDYTEAFETLQKEMDAGRVNSNAFYAAAEMLLGAKAYEATGGNSAAIRAAMNEKGASGSAYDAWKILTQKYYNKETGAELEGFGFAQLLSQTNGLDRSKFLDENGNISIKLTSEDIAGIANAWNIDSAFLMAAWNAFDQYDQRGDRKTDDLMEQQQQETADASADAGEAVGTFSDSATEAAAAMDTAQASAHNLASAMANAADAADRFAGNSGDGDGKSADGATQSTARKKGSQETRNLFFGIDVDQLLEQQSSLIEETKGLTDKYDTVIGDYNETIAGYDELITQAKDMSEKAAETLEEVNTYLDESTTEETAKKAAETQKIIDGLIARNPALAGAKEAGEKAGEEFGEAFSFKSSEYTGEALDTSMFGDSGEKAGEEFGEEYWQNMLLTAQRYKNGEDILPQYEEQLEKDLTESGGFIETVIEKYKAALAEAKAEAQKLNEELGKGEEKDVNVNVNDDQAEKDLNKITKPDTKTVTVSIVEAAGGGGRIQSILHQATGTRSHPGGYSLVNDGSGPELIVDNGQAFIAGGGKPTIVGLNKGAKVFTASETRAILNGASVPAYDSGTFAGGLFSVVTTEKPDTSGKKDDKSSKSLIKGKKSGAKVDKQAFSNLSSMIDYIIGRIGTALDEQLQVLDKQIEALQKAREAAEEQNKLEELQQNVTDALNERTVRYLGEDGKWHWMADQKNVQQAQKSLREYEDELAFNAQVKEIEDQKTALQDEYNEITKTWSDIKNAVSTPTGSLEALLQAVLTGGTPQQKAGAKSVQDTLISGIVQGVYTKNYDEALDAIAKATEGNPIMPGSGAASLASLIAMTGSGATGDSVTEALKTAASPISSITGSNGALAAGNNTNINYFIDGIKLGEGMENMPLSSIMKNLSVYTNTGVN